MSDQETDQANNGEDRAPWTIKSVHVETRKLAVACAAREGLTIGQWLERATRGQAETDKGNAVLPPSMRPMAFEPVGMTLNTEHLKPATSLAALDEVLAVLHRVYATQQDANGASIPMPGKMHSEIAATTRLAFSLARTAMRQVRGLPEPKVRDRSRDKPRVKSSPRLKLASGSSVVALVSKPGR